MPTLSRRIRCAGIAYRAGSIEVVPAIHPGFVNLETWQISADEVDSEPGAGDSFDANIELELAPMEARQLAQALLDAAEVADMPCFELDGTAISTLEAFFGEVSRVLIPGANWGHNLDAFNDILRGGFGTPEGGFVILWIKHHVSREHLGYAETIRQLELRMKRCHPSNRPLVAAQLEAARRSEGPTVFDWLLDIIAVHGPGGREAQDRVRLDLR